MSLLLQRAVGAVLRLTGLQYWPVRVRRGLPVGARWTLYPWSSYWRGDYEPEVERAILALGNLTGKTCWDLGAHFGYYSIGLARRVGPTGQVAAFEPFAPSFARLERHRRMNRLDWLRTFPCAASDRTGRQEFFADTAQGDTVAHLAYEGEARTAKTPAIPVPTVRLDELVLRGEIRAPDFIKIDVEGHGHRTLAGALESVRSKRPVILMGFHSPQEVAGTRALLDPLGYRWEPLRPDAPSDPIGHDCLLRPA